MGSRLRIPVIVGIDPGIRVGLCVLSVKGEILLLSTFKTPTKAKILKEISKFGEPILVACDVNPIPRMVKRIASSLGIRFFYPEASLSEREKTKLVKKFREEIKDSHQKDSLAAAIKAHKKYSELFSKIKNELKKIGREEIYEEVILRLMKGHKENIKDAIREILNEEKI